MKNTRWLGLEKGTGFGFNVIRGVNSSFPGERQWLLTHAPPSRTDMKSALLSNSTDIPCIFLLLVPWLPTWILLPCQSSLLRLSAWSHLPYPHAWGLLLLLLHRCPVPRPSACDLLPCRCSVLKPSTKCLLFYRCPVPRLSAWGLLHHCCSDPWPSA